MIPLFFLATKDKNKRKGTGNIEALIYEDRNKKEIILIK